MNSIQYCFNMILLLSIAVIARAQSYKVGDTAPGFQGLPKYENGTFGDTLASADYSGKILFYNFFGSY